MLNNVCFENDICFIIPAHNEEKVLSSTIDSIIKCGGNVKDIYVVDDASKDNTSKVASSLNVNLLTLQKNKGKALALKSLIDEFDLCNKYEFITFVDADTKLDINFLGAMRMATVHNNTVSLYVGKVKPIRGGLITACRSVEYALGQDLFKSGMSRQGIIFVAPGCASMYRGSVLKQLNFDSNTLAEDMDLTMQVQRMKREIIYVENAIVYTQDPKNIKDYSKQVTRWFRGTWQVIKKHSVFAIKKKQKVDLAMIFLMSDALIFNRFIWVIASFLLFSVTLKAVLFAFLFDIFVTFLVAIYASYKDKRWDVIYKFPFYFWLTSYLNPFIFLKTFFEIMVFDKKSYSWNKVARY
jgi:cellulose synthase/poly-beta-1,6-N-acetylglucosamine synthase-like glycosyltransferase